MLEQMGDVAVYLSINGSIFLGYGLRNLVSIFID